MKVRFSTNNIGLPESMKKLGYSTLVNFHLKDGENYTVYGLVIWNDILHYLIVPIEENLPNWIPADFFEIIDPRLPRNWFIKYFGDNDPKGLEILIGYEELVLDELYYENLIELETNELRTFYLRKKEIDEEACNNNF